MWAQGGYRHVKWEGLKIISGRGLRANESDGYTIYIVPANAHINSISRYIEITAEIYIFLYYPFITSAMLRFNRNKVDYFI